MIYVLITNFKCFCIKSENKENIFAICFSFISRKQKKTSVQKIKKDQFMEMVQLLRVLFLLESEVEILIW